MEKLRRYVRYEEAMKRQRSICDMFVLTLAIMGLCGAAILFAISLADISVPAETDQQRADSIGAARHYEEGASK